MISFLNIPPESPIDFLSSPPRSKRFSFPPSNNVGLDSYFVATFSGTGQRHAEKYAKYLEDGRKLMDGKPIEPISAPECWEHLIMHSHLFKKTDMNLKTQQMPSQQLHRRVRRNGSMKAQRKKSPLEHLFKLFIYRKEHVAKLRRPNSSFY